MFVKDAVLIRLVCASTGHMTLSLHRLRNSPWRQGHVLTQNLFAYIPNVATDDLAPLTSYSKNAGQKF